MVGNEAQSAGWAFYLFFLRSRRNCISSGSRGGGEEASEGGWRKGVGGYLTALGSKAVRIFIFLLIHWFWGGAVVMVGRRDAGNG